MGTLLEGTEVPYYAAEGFFFFFLIDVYTPSYDGYECYRNATTSYYPY